MEESQLKHTRSKRYSSKKQYKVNRAREMSFINQWGVNAHKDNYDALEDPHAAYYFVSTSVKRHLKGFKRAIKDERNSTEARKLKKLIREKIAFKFPDVHKTDGQSNNKPDDVHSSMKSGVQKMKGNSKKSKKRFYREKSKQETLDLPNINGTEKGGQRQSESKELSQLNLKRELSKKSLSKPRQSSKMLKEEVEHQKNHTKFVDFLESKKKLLEKDNRISRKTSRNQENYETQKKGIAGNRNSKTENHYHSVENTKIQ